MSVKDSAEKKKEMMSKEVEQEIIKPWVWCVLSALLLLLIVFYFSKSATMFSLFSTNIFMHFHTCYSSEPTSVCMLHPLHVPRCTRLFTPAHPYTVKITFAWVNQHLHSFIFHSYKLWNSLPFLFITWPLSRRGYQDLSPPEVYFSFGHSLLSLECLFSQKISFPSCNVKITDYMTLHSLFTQNSYSLNFGGPKWVWG